MPDEFLRQSEDKAESKNTDDSFNPFETSEDDLSTVFSDFESNNLDIEKPNNDAYYDNYSADEDVFSEGDVDRSKVFMIDGVEPAKLAREIGSVLSDKNIVVIALTPDEIGVDGISVNTSFGYIQSRNRDKTLEEYIMKPVYLNSLKIDPKAPIITYGAVIHVPMLEESDLSIYQDFLEYASNNPNIHIVLLTRVTELRGYTTISTKQELLDYLGLTATKSKKKKLPIIPIIAGVLLLLMVVIMSVVMLTSDKEPLEIIPKPKGSIEPDTIQIEPIPTTVPEPEPTIEETPKEIEPEPKTEEPYIEPYMPTKEPAPESEPYMPPKESEPYIEPVNPENKHADDDDYSSDV
jgi:hypothetical protein